jgi:hypothetical protein
MRYRSNIRLVILAIITLTPCDVLAQTPHQGECRDAGIGIETLVTPVAKNVRSFYNNRVQIYNIDTIEPAAGPAGIAIVLPDNDDPLGGSKCFAIRNFGEIDIKAARVAYDPAKGLSLSIPTRSTDSETGRSKPGPQLNVLTDLQRSSVTFLLGGSLVERVEPREPPPPSLPPAPLPRAPTVPQDGPPDWGPTPQAPNPRSRIINPAPTEISTAYRISSIFIFDNSRV